LAASNYNRKKIQPPKKRYSCLADGWKKSQITVCRVKIQTPIITKLKKLRPEKKKVQSSGHWLELKTQIKNMAGQTTVPFFFRAVIFLGFNWCSCFDTSTNYGTYIRLEKIITRKKGTVVWPAMFSSGFKLQPDKITTQKKRYSHLADGWNTSQITVCRVKIWTPIITKLEKIRTGEKGTVVWSLVGAQNTKHKTQHTQTQQPTRWTLPPYPPAALPPLSPWVEQWRHQIMALPLPNTMRILQAVGVVLAVVGLLALGDEIRGIK
jgi:hypothetical protein